MKKLTPLEAAKRRLAHALQEVVDARTAADELRVETGHVEFKEPYSPHTHELRLTSKQLDHVQEALEFYSRWCMGHFILPDVVEFRRVPHRMPGVPYPPSRAGERALDFPHNQEAKGLLDALRQLLFPELRSPGQHYGVGWDERPEQQAMQIAYEVQRAIREHRTHVHHLADPNFMGNVYSGRGLHYSDQTRPIVTPLDLNAQVQQYREFLAELAIKYPVDKDATF
jgi:hypothetical protein